MSTGKAGVALIGAGNISTQYLDNLTTFPDVEVVAITDLFPEAAKARAEEYGVALHGTPDVALEHPEVEVIVNLTIPAAHAEVGRQAVRAGKHVWSEKPIALDRESGRELLTEADAAGLRVGCAPDTFLGAGLQSAFRAIQNGDIGRPLSAQTVMQYPGPDLWHPNPAFLFQTGAGPLFDMGPYYVTALVQAFGSARRVSAMGSKAWDVRKVHTGPREGETFEVEVPTHISALIEFEEGGISQSAFSFQSPYKNMGYLEIAGTEGTLLVPDPNYFDGELKIIHPGEEEWTVIPTTGPANGRGMGVLDLVRSARAGLPHRASGELAFHVLDTMIALQESADTGSFVDVDSTAPKCDPLPEDWDPLAATLGGGTQ